MVQDIWCYFKKLKVIFKIIKIEILQKESFLKISVIITLEQHKKVLKNKNASCVILYYIPRTVFLWFISRHPNIAKLLGFFADEARIYIVFEYCEYGTLEQYQKTLPGCRIEENM